MFMHKPKSALLRMLFLLFAVALVAAACGSDDSDDAAPASSGESSEAEESSASEDMDEESSEDMADIVETAVAAGDFTTLVAALEAADLVATLQGQGPFTVFAPTDAAFAALPAGTVEGLLEDIPALTDVLTYHVVDGMVLAADVVTLDSATALNGDEIGIAATDDGVVLNGTVNVVTTDIETSNGVIHVVDAVLLPPEDS